MFGKRQRTDALSGYGEDGVANGWKHRGKRGFAEAGGWILGLQEMDFDFGGDLIHAHGRVLVEIALDGAAGVDGDFVVHDGT